MKLTKKQIKDLNSVKYFIPKALKNNKITDEDIRLFFEYSDRWLNWDKIKGYRVWNIDWFNTLIEWKRWRGIHIWMYEQWILDWSVPYYDLLKWMPLDVKDIIKKEMFKWVDKDRIDEIWILRNNKWILIKEWLEFIIWKTNRRIKLVFNKILKLTWLN